MSDIIKHIVVADFLGEILSYSDKYRINSEITGFVIGVGSHILLDIIDNEFVINWFYFEDLIYAFPFIIFELIFAIFIIRSVIDNSIKESSFNLVRINFILGALIPDIIDGIYALIKPGSWYSGSLLFPWHISTQPGEPMSMYKTIIYSLGLIIIRYLISIIFLQERKNISS
ncbi:MAG: hypothetical protein ACOC4G_01395 [Bacillota bacterium]